MQAIGIDIGTTSICCIVTDTENGKVLHSETKDSNAFILGVAEWEKIQDTEKIISIATSLLDSYICEETAVIGVTGQMHGIVYTDKDGKAVSPLYTWQDGRGNQPYKDTTYAEYLNSHSGYGNVTDFYNRTNGIIPKEAVNYCTVHDYFVMRLCGKSKAEIHTSDAASLGLFDLKTNKFNYGCDIDVVTDYHIVGKYKEIPVSVAIGDNQASVFSTLTDPQKLLINIGTGSQISVISDDIIEKANIETRPYFENKYLIVGAALCGGRAFATLKNFYKSILEYVTDPDDKLVYGIMDKMLEDITSCSLSADTRFSGTRADRNIKGSINNITTENFKPAELSFAFLEGMISELYEMYNSMGVNRNGIIGSGNGLRLNPALIKIAENKFGCPMEIPTHTEEAAFGAALFGMVSAGIYKNAYEVGQLIKFSKA